MADPLVIDPRLLDTHRPQARLERTLRQSTITHDQPPSVLAHAALVLLHIRADFRFDGRLQHLLCSLAQQFVQRRTAARFNLLFQTDYILLFHRCPEGCAAIVCWQQCFLSPSGCLFSTPRRPQLLEISPHSLESSTGASVVELQLVGVFHLFETLDNWPSRP